MTDMQRQLSGRQAPTRSRTGKTSGAGARRRRRRRARRPPPAPIRPGRLLTWLPADAFPANRELPASHVRGAGGPPWLVDALRRRPPARIFQNVEQLAHALRTRQSHLAVDDRTATWPTTRDDRRSTKPGDDR